MTDDELLKDLNDIESDRVERKQSIADGDRIRQTICAFANNLPGHTKPGVLFVGVDDDGSPVGLEVTDQLLRKYAIPPDAQNSTEYKSNSYVPQPNAVRRQAACGLE